MNWKQPRECVCMYACVYQRRHCEREMENELECRFWSMMWWAVKRWITVVGVWCRLLSPPLAYSHPISDYYFSPKLLGSLPCMWETQMQFLTPSLPWTRSLYLWCKLSKTKSSFSLVDSHSLSVYVPLHLSIKWKYMIFKIIN